MRLTIGENEGTLLSLLNKEGELSATEIVESSYLPSGSVGTTLTRMTEKGWISFREEDINYKTPLHDKKRLYLLTDLGYAAYRAWNIYSSAPGATDA